MGPRLMCLAAAILLAVPAVRAAENPSPEDRRTLHLLIRDLADKKPRVQADAARRLKQLGPPAVPDLVLALDGRHIAVSTLPDDRREVVRARAANVLGALGGTRAARHLLLNLQSRSRLVRRAAVRALGDMACKDAVEPLVKLISGPDAALAGDALLALGAIGDKAATQDVLAILHAADALANRYRNDADVSRVRGNAAFALGMIGDTAAVPKLLTGLNDPDTRVRRFCDLALRRLSGRTLGFRPDAPPAERERVAKAWHAFWKAKLKP